MAISELKKNEFWDSLATNYNVFQLIVVIPNKFLTKDPLDKLTGLLTVQLVDNSYTS